MTKEGNEQNSARWQVLVGMMGAVAFILMATVQFPILPAAPFLKYDPSDAVGLLAAFLLGPTAGVAVVAVKNLLFLFFRAGTPFGPLANFIAVGTFVGVAGWVYQRGRSASVPWLLLACAAGALARVVVMIPANFIILYLAFGLPPAHVAELLWPAIVPFNSVVSAVNAVLAVAIMAVLPRRWLRRAEWAAPSSSKA